jgi:hypothetical protein
MTTASKNPQTLALHGGSYRSDPATGSVAVPICQTTSYQFLGPSPPVRSRYRRYSRPTMDRRCSAGHDAKRPYQLKDAKQS